MVLWPSVQQKTIQVLEQDEGKKNRPYRDTKGLWTIGVGRLIGQSLEQITLSDKIIEEMLAEDLAAKYKDAVRLFGEDWLEEQTEARQTAIISLMFSLGIAKLSAFTQTVPAIKKEKWDSAAELLLKTKWAHDVDPKKRTGAGRDDRIAYMLRTGEYPPEYDLE